MTQNTRPELTALYERLARTEDAARSEAARKRHARALPKLAGKLQLLQQGQWQRTLDGER